jgi:two-component system response regulator
MTEIMTWLLVEDTESDLELTLHALRGCASASDMVVARDGEQALDYVFATGLHSARNKDVMPEAILLNLHLPKIDGLEVLRRIRADPRARSIIVILLTSRADEQSVIDGLDAGADDYVVKPFSARELLARLRTHLELARQRQEWVNELTQKNAQLQQANEEMLRQIAGLHDVGEQVKALNRAIGPRPDLRVGLDPVPDAADGKVQR